MSRNTIWIIGASRGIGAELVKRYSALGWHVIGCARDTQALKQLADAHRNVSTLTMDVTSEQSVNAAWAELVSRRKLPDTVIYNSGDYVPQSVDSLSASTASALMDVNYLGFVRVLENMLPVFMRRNHGQIVAVGSVAAYQGLPKSLAYGASKAALVNFCEGMRLELAHTNVDVRLVSPGFVRTALTANNRFKMPFLMEPDDAAKRIEKGLHTSRFEITFPRRFAILLKTIRLLPYGISLAILRKATVK